MSKFTDALIALAILAVMAYIMAWNEQRIERNIKETRKSKLVYPSMCIRGKNAGAEKWSRWGCSRPKSVGHSPGAQILVAYHVES